MARSNEAFWWSLFSAGGVMSALFVPAFILATGLVVPFLAADHGPTTYARLLRAVSWWPVRVVLFVVIFLSFFHCAHRIRHLLGMAGLEAARTSLSVVCYGGALAGTVATVIVLARL